MCRRQERNWRFSATGAARRCTATKATRCSGSTASCALVRNRLRCRISTDADDRRSGCPAHDEGRELVMARHNFWMRLAATLALAALAAGCAAGKAFRRGEAAMRAGDVDAAVAAYRKAVQEAPDNASYKIALQRAMLAASRAHIERAKEYEQNDQLEAALGEYKQAAEYDPTNRLASNKAIEIDRTLRERAEAARPKPQIELARERARAASQPTPLFNFTTRLPRLNFLNTSLRDILTFIGQATGV